MKYKVVERMHGEFVAKAVEKSVFEGSLIELNAQFPASKVWGADPLSHKEIEDGYVRWDYTFFKSHDGLNWEESEDPRSHANRSLTDLERAIDEENRRLFPGDYIEGDDDYYQDEDDDLYY